MDRLTFVSELMKSIIWPITILIIIIILKKPIENLLTSLARMRFKDIEFEFSKNIEELKKTAVEAQLPEKISLDDPDSLLYTQYKELLALAELSPSAAILESWSMIEQELRNYSKEKELDGWDKKPPYELQRQLVDKGYMPPLTFTLLNNLRKLRNIVAHQGNVTISNDAIYEFLNTSFKIIEALQNSSFTAVAI